jgi:hypothetical protein
MASFETDAPTAATGLPATVVRTGLLAGLVLALGTAVGLLWWRFGEGVYATSIMNAILACF